MANVVDSAQPNVLEDLAKEVRDVQLLWYRKLTQTHSSISSHHPR